MAKLVIGTTGSGGVPAMVKEVAVIPPLVIRFVKNQQGVAQKTGLIDLDGATDIEAHGLMDAYYKSSAISGTIDFSSLTSLTEEKSCNSTFMACPNITGANLSGLTTVTGNSACANMFSAAASIASVDLSSLTTIGQPSVAQYNSSIESMCSNMVSGTSITSLNLSSLVSVIGKTAAYGMFQNNAHLTSVDISNLKIVYGPDAISSMFATCQAMRQITFNSLDTIGSPGYNPFYSTFWGWRDAVINFPALKTTSFINNNTGLFNNMLKSATNCTVHFPSNLQTLMSGWSDVTSGFNGTNTTVLFDLPATE